MTCNWREGGDSRAELHAVGGALIGGLGGGGAFSTIGGAAGAGDGWDAERHIEGCRVSNGLGTDRQPCRQHCRGRSDGFECPPVQPDS
jgi:hypothetical protein